MGCDHARPANRDKNAHGRAAPAAGAGGAGPPGAARPRAQPATVEYYALLKTLMTQPEQIKHIHAYEHTHSQAHVVQI